MVTIGDEPLVTVAVPTRNRADLLARTIRSVLDQTEPRFEVVVLDNASTDDTPSVVADFVTSDPRVSLARIEHGVPMHENVSRCFTAGTAPYVTILHDDDLMRPENLARKLPLLEADPAVGLVYSTYAVIDIDDEVLRPRLSWNEPAPPKETGEQFIARSLAGPNRVHMSAAVFRRDMASGVRAEEGDRAYIDLGMWLRLALRADVAYVDEPLCAVRIHGRTVSAESGYYTVDGDEVDDETIDQLRDLHDVKLRFLREHGSRVTDPKRLRTRATAYMSRRLVRLVDQKTRPSRRPVETLRLLGQAATVEPRVLATKGAVTLALNALAGSRARQVLRRVA